jgi:hypothetical protein
MATFQPNSKTVYANPATYTPDFSFLDGMLKRKEAQYNQGFAQVSQKYSALNQSLSHADNIEERDNFLKQAKDNLKNLSAMDLSLDQNVKEAGNVFAPLYENENIIGDMRLTKHYDAQEAIANSYKFKDEGKQYSEDNINFVRKQRNQFVNDNRENWKTYYGSKRSFTPYYDYNKELEDKMKNFHSDMIDLPRQAISQFEYKKVTKSVGDDPTSVRSYLEGVLSDKAKQQMAIEADVRLGDNPDAVVGYYKNAAQNLENVAKDKYETVDALFRTTKFKNSAEKEQYKKILDETKTKYESAKASNLKIKNGDTSEIIKDMKTATFNVYYDMKMDKLSKAYSESLAKVYKEDYSINQAALTQWKESMDEARSLRDYNQRERFHKQEQEKNVPIVGDVNFGETFKSGIKKYEDDVNTLKIQSASITKDMNSYMLNALNSRNDVREHYGRELTEGDLIKNDSYAQKLVANFHKENTNDLAFKRLIDEKNKISTKLRIIQNKINATKSEVIKGFSEEEKNQYKQYEKSISDLNKLPGITVNGKKYSGKEIAEGLNNGTIKYNTGLENLNNSSFLSIKDKQQLAKDIKNQSLTIDGKKYNLTQDVVKVIEKVIGRNEFNVKLGSANIISKFNKSLESKMPQDFTTNYPALYYRTDSEAYKQSASYLENIMGKDAVVSGVAHSPYNDRIIFNVNPTKESDKDVDQIITDLQAKFPTKKVGKLADGRVWVEDATFFKNKIFSTFPQHVVEVIKGDPYMESNKMSEYFYPTGQSTDLKGNDLPAFAYKRTDNNKYYLYLINQDSKEQMVSGLFDNLPDLMTRAQAYTQMPNALKEDLK